MARPLIYITELSGQAKIYPGEFLGPIPFKAYRDACRNAGASFDPKVGANLMRLDLLPRLLDGLQAAFSVKIAPEVQVAAQNRASELLRSRAQASGRVAQLQDRPYPFQEIGIAALASRSSFLLADEMGLGKTVQALLALPEGSGALVLCPASLKGEWIKACLRWRPDFQPRLLERFEIPQSGELLVINYERLPVSKKEALVKTLKPTEMLLSDAIAGHGLTDVILIADEFHYVKAARSGRTQRYRELAKAVRQAGGRTWGLTGTPMPNTPMDLLNVLTGLDLLKESFGNYIRFCQLMNGKQDYWGKWTFGQPKPEAIEALRRVMLRRRRSEVLPDLPTITYEEIEVDIKASARRASDQARAAMAAAGVDLQSVVEGRQGFGASSETVFTARRLLAEAKIPALIEIVERYIESGEPLIVGSAHRAPIEALANIANCKVMSGDHAVSARTAMVQEFQNGVFTVIGGTIKVIGVGFTLTRAAHVLVVDDEWTPDWHDQFVSRACRIGQTRGVLVKRMIAPDTVDQDHAVIIAAKRKLISATIEKAAGASIEADPDRLMNLGGI